MDKFVAVLVGMIAVLLIALFATNFATNMVEEEAVPETQAEEETIPEPIQPLPVEEAETPAKEEAEAKGEAGEVTGKNCVDSDGLDYSTAGKVTFYKSEYPDKCTTSTQIYERYCDENERIKAVIETCANGCENGACRSEELAPKQAACFDSDDLNYNVYGYVEYDGNIYRDGCTGSLVKENYCKDNKPYAKSYTCADGCEFGACKQKEAITEEKKCTDSDSGLDYYTLGYVVYNDIRYDDRCTGSISLSERYCEYDNLKTRDFKCPDYCLKGICIKTPVCEDAVRDEGEECDGYDFGGKTCLDYGYNGGSLLCRIDCKIKFNACK